MNEDMKSILLQLVDYSFAPIDYDFEMLTDTEKQIVQNQKTLDEIRVLVEG